MPIHKQDGGFEWGSHGKVYPTRAGAERQAQAAHANGFREAKGGEIMENPYRDHEEKLDGDGMCAICGEKHMSDGGEADDMDIDFPGDKDTINGVLDMCIALCDDPESDYAYGHTEETGAIPGSEDSGEKHDMPDAEPIPVDGVSKMVADMKSEEDKDKYVGLGMRRGR